MSDLEILRRIAERGLSAAQNDLTDLKHADIWQHMLDEINRVPTADVGCICRGNWRAIVEETEPLLRRTFVNVHDNSEWSLFGVVDGFEDYYYGMTRRSNGEMRLLSCVGSIEGHGYVLKPRKKIFVFGSNLAGRHGAGSALEAVKNHGAIRTVGVGHTGNSYAIPTKDVNLRTLPLRDIEEYVFEFVQFARYHPEMEFDVVKIGCGLAGYDEEDIAPMFKNAGDNIILPEGWREIINKRYAPVA